MVSVFLVAGGRNITLYPILPATGVQEALRTAGVQATSCASGLMYCRFPGNLAYGWCPGCWLCIQAYCIQTYCIQTYCIKAYCIQTY